MKIRDFARRQSEKVKQTANIRLFEHISMAGAYNDNLFTALQVGNGDDRFTKRYFEIRSASVVVATGCIECPLLFENNERPGVLQVGCAHRPARTYGLLPGLEAAVDLFDLGLKINCVADIREDGQAPDLMLALAERKIPLLRGWVFMGPQRNRRQNHRCRGPAPDGKPVPGSDSGRPVKTDFLPGSRGFSHSGRE